MSVRLFVTLALVLGILTISATSYIWLSRSEGAARAAIRQSKIARQILEQQRVYLQNPDNRERIESLQQSLQELQLQLVELLSPVNTNPGIDSVRYEQSILDKVIQIDSTSDMRTLRVVLNLTAQHSSAILVFLATLQQSVPTWPSEVRACDMNRMPSSRISVECVVDFYHWSSADGQRR